MIRNVSLSSELAVYVGQGAMSRNGIQCVRAMYRARHREGSRHDTITNASAQTLGSHHTESSYVSPVSIAGTTGCTLLHDIPDAADDWRGPASCAKHPTPSTRTSNAVPSPALASVASACGADPFPYLSGASHSERAPYVTHPGRRASTRRHQSATTVEITVANAVAAAAASPTPSQKLLPKSQFMAGRYRSAASIRRWFE